MKASNGTDSVKNNTAFNDDDDEHLEALRLAALESLRAKGLPPPPVKITSPQRNAETPAFVYRPHMVNQNLISIIPIEDVAASKVEGSTLLKPAAADTNKLPQPKPASLPVSEDEDKPKASSKFSRYEDSESEDSDEFDLELKKSDDESDADECELRIGDVEDLLLKSPTPPIQTSVPAANTSEEGRKSPEVSLPPEKKSEKVQKKVVDQTPAKITSNDKPKPTLKKIAERSKSPGTTKSSSRQLSPRRGRSPSESRHRPLKRKTPDRSLTRKVRDSPPRHRPRNSPTSRKTSPRPPHKRSSPVLPRGAERSPPRPKKTIAELVDGPNSPKTKSTDLAKLEARKRKFENAMDSEPVIQSRKIKLSKDETIKAEDKQSDRKTSRGESSSAELKQKEKKKAAEAKEESSDLRAELQRRRINRTKVQEIPQATSKGGSSSDSRRILVMKSKIATPDQDAGVGKTNIRERLGVVESDPSSNSLADNRIKLKRPTSAATSVEAEKGTSTGSHVELLEDRIRRIQAMNDALLKRHLELEADKLLFA